MASTTGGGEPPGGSAPLGDVDEVTVRRAQRGDAAALEAVLRDLAPYLGRVCGVIALDAGDDALQEAMVAIARNPNIRTFYPKRHPLRPAWNPYMLRKWQTV